MVNTENQSDSPPVRAERGTGGKTSSKSSGPIQFITLNRWRRERSMLEVFLVNGQRLVGRIRSFDRFSMLLDMPQGGCFVFHHTVSTVQPAGKGSTRRPVRPGRPREDGLDEGASRRDPAQPKSYASVSGRAYVAAACYCSAGARRQGRATQAQNHSARPGIRAGRPSTPIRRLVQFSGRFVQKIPFIRAFVKWRDITACD